MKYIGTLLVVDDIHAAVAFYRDVLGLQVIQDFKDNIMLENGLYLQTKHTWKSFIHKNEEEIILENNAIEIYFEEADIDAFEQHLLQFNIHYVHALMEHRWGQRVIRFYDLDKHIIEVAEPLKHVIKRYRTQGLTDIDIASRMEVSVEYIQMMEEYEWKQK